MPIFGNSTQGSYGPDNINNIIIGYKASPATSGTLTKISAYIFAPYATGTVKVKCALYNNNGTLVPNSQTIERTWANEIASGWYDFTFSGTGPSVTAGQTYIIAIWGSTAGTYLQFLYDFTPGDTVLNCMTQALTYTTNFPSTLASPVYSAHRNSIYATYTEAVNPDWYLTISTNVGGYVTPDGIGTFKFGYSIYATETANVSTGNFKFDGWKVDGGPLNLTNPISLTFTDGLTHTLEAHFSLISTVVIPTVTTDPIITSEVQDTQAIVRGNIVATGGENCTQRGFDIGTASGPPYNMSVTPEPGTFGTGAFAFTITNLTANTTYYFRAKAYNSMGWGYGVQQSFTTASTPPGAVPFGKTTNGTALEGFGVELNGSGSKYGSQYHNSKAGTFSAVFARTKVLMWHPGDPNYPPIRLKAGIADVNGTILALSSYIEISASDADFVWRAFPITPIALGVGDYWLLIWVGSYNTVSNGVDYDAGVSISNVANEDFNAPIVGGTTGIVANDTNIFDIYAGSSAPLPPTADFIITPAIAVVGSAVTFDASTSKGGWDGTRVTTIADPAGYVWRFGDGASTTGKIVTHTYTTKGNYNVTLTVTDNAGRYNTLTLPLQVYDVGGATLEYATGFEHAQRNSRLWYMNLDPDPVYNFPLSNYVGENPRIWVYPTENAPVTPLPANFLATGLRPGSTRCLVMQWDPSIKASYDRSNISLWVNRSINTDNETGTTTPQPNICHDEFYLKEWLFIPDFTLYSTWYNLLQISNTMENGNSYPYYAVEIVKRTSTTYAALLDWRDAPGVQHYVGTKEDFQNILPIGRWFKLEWYMLRHKTNGVVKCWVDGVQIFNVAGLDTTTPDKYGSAATPNGQFSIEPARIYCSDESSGSGHWLFVDDIEIWSSIPLGAVSIAATPTSVTMQQGATQRFTASIAGGLAPYMVQWIDKSNGSVLHTNVVAPYTYDFIATAPGTYGIYAKVTDSSSPALTSNSPDITITVVPPLAVSVTPSTWSMFVGETKTFTANPTGGVSPYTYQWNLNGSPVTNATSKTFNFTPSTTGPYNITVTVKDAFPITITSASVPITVKTANPPSITSVSSIPSPATITVGQSVSFSAMVTSDLAAYTVTWYDAVYGAISIGNPPNTPVPITFNGAGTFYIYAIATSAAGSSVQSNQITVTVGPIIQGKLVTDIIANPTSFVKGGSSLITVTITANGTPISGASVTLSATGGTLAQSGTTNASGIFTTPFTDSIAQTVTITGSATKSGYDPSDQHQTVVQVLNSQSITVTVIAANGTTDKGTGSITLNTGDTITAQASSGYQFKQWLLGTPGGTPVFYSNQPSIVIVQDMANKELTAEFALPTPITSTLLYASLGLLALGGIYLLANRGKRGR